MCKYANCICNGKYKIERYNIDKEALEDILEQYNEYCNEKNVIKKILQL